MDPIIPSTMRIMARQRRFFFTGGLILHIILLTLTHSTTILAENTQRLVVGGFSHTTPGGPLPSDWKPLLFEKIGSHTQYELVKNDGQVVVKAMSRQSASGLTREITLNPREYPIMTWRWKVENILKKGDVHKKSGDDYPARLYITFQYDSEKVGLFEKAKFEAMKFIYGQYPPIGAINYIWANHAPPGTMIPNPYTDRVYMFVTESGSEKVGQWVTETRNVYEDYQKAFGEDPPAISGIAIMTDTDNTRETAVAYFGDIIFQKRMNEE